MSPLRLDRRISYSAAAHNMREKNTYESRPRVILRTGMLECVIEGTGDGDALASLAGALRREVFDV